MKFPLYLLMLLALIATACSSEDLPDEFAEDPMESATDGDSDSQDESGEPDPAEGDSGDSDSGSEENQDPGDEEGTDPASCDPADFIFNERDGVVLGEMEASAYTGPWEFSDMEADASGDGYLVWSGSDLFNNPGEGTLAIKLQINTPGTYRFTWRSAVTLGDNGTEHNDSWLRFPDADDFYAEKGESRVYPKGSGKSPNPEGSGADGWFKIYRSGNDLGFKWQARTYDNNPHDIYVTFAAPGVYSMEVSGRSSGHAIDRFLLHKTDLSESGALAMEPSEISCAN